MKLGSLGGAEEGGCGDADWEQGETQQQILSLSDGGSILEAASGG